MSLNKVILMGNLTAKPVLMNGNQVPYTHFSVAVNDYNSKTMEESADFIQCAAFYHSAEFICNYYDKGSSIIIEGSLKQNNYKDRLGVQHYSYQVIVNRAYFAGKKEQTLAAPVQSPAAMSVPVMAQTPAASSASATAVQPTAPSSLGELFADCPDIDLVPDDDGSDAS